MVLVGFDRDHRPKSSPVCRRAPWQGGSGGFCWEKRRTCLLSVVRVQHDKPRFDVVALGCNSLLARQPSKPSAPVAALPAGPGRSTLPACPGNSASGRCRRSVRLCVPREAKGVGGLDPGREGTSRSYRVLPPIPFRGLSDTRVDRERLTIPTVGMRARTSVSHPRHSVDKVMTL